MSVITASDIQNYIALYFGGRQEWFDYWSTWRAKDGATIDIKQFVHKNFLRKIIKLWADGLPGFTVTLNREDPDKAEKRKVDKAGKPVLTELELKFNKWVDDFFSRSGWEGNSDFWTALPFYRVLIPLTGNLLIKLPVNADGQVVPTRIRQESVFVIGDGKTVKGVTGWKFWYRIQTDSGFTTSSGAGLFVEETIKWKDGIVDGEVEWTRSTDGQSYKTAEAATKEDLLNSKALKVFPLVHMAYEPQEDTPLGFPVAKHLIDVCLDICSAYTDMRKANKKTAGQQLVLKNTTGDGIDLDGALEIHDQNPGSTADAKYIGGGLTLTALEKELEEHKKDAYEIANVPYPGKDDIANAPGRSGKAQIVLSAPQRAAISNYQKIEGQGWAELLQKSWNLENPDELIEIEEVTVEFDQFDSPDPDEKIKRADFYEASGFKRQALREMGIEDEDQIDRLFEEKAESDANSVSAINDQFNAAGDGSKPADGVPTEPTPPKIPPVKDLSPKLPAA